MRWLSEEASSRELDPDWPVLPNTALIVMKKIDRSHGLLGEEADMARTMGDKRRADFSSGRYSAHKAQALLGLEPQPILREERSPVWPPGQCGSISHTRDWVVAGVSTELKSLGVDIESIDRVKPRLYQTLFRPEERSVLAGLPRAAPTVMFCAKEAGYKAIFPIGGTFVGFQEASIELDWYRQKFHIRYHGAHAANQTLESGFGFWRLTPGHVITFFSIQD